MIKILKPELEGNLLNPGKDIYEELTGNTSRNGEKLGAFPLRSERVQGFSPSLLLLNTGLEILARAVRQ